MTTKGSSTKKTDTSDVRTSIFDLIDTITGNDELLVDAKFDIDVWDVVEPFMAGTGMATTVKTMRIMLFIQRLHEGDQPDVAYHFALDKTAKELTESFKDDIDEAEDESTVVGKGAPDAA